jgi:DNA primase
MIDAAIIKSHFDCRDVVEADLGKPKTRSANYNVYKCPFHREVKGYSLVVYSDHWQCFGACQETGDVIKWIMKRQDLDFKAACNSLTGNIPVPFKSYQSAPRPQPRETPSEPPGQAWQESARWILDQAETELWSPNGERAMSYLRNRGLYPDTIRAAKLGYVPGDMKTWYTFEADGQQFKHPSGITIPWFADNALWGVNVRRPARPGEVKYQQFSGGHTKGALYWVDDLVTGWPVLFTEGEFDCLIAWQCGQDFVCTVTLGGASNPLSSRWYKLLASSPHIIAVTDNDEAGDRAGDRLAGLSARVRRVHVPTGKDLTDFFLDTNLGTVSQWIEEVLAHAA